MHLHSGAHNKLRRDQFIENVVALELHQYHSYPTIRIGDLNSTGQSKDTSAIENISLYLLQVYVGFSLIDGLKSLFPQQSVGTFPF